MDVESLRQVIDQRFDSLDEVSRERFDALGKRIDGLTAQMTITNGRVTAHDITLGVTLPKITALEEAARNPSQRVTTTTSTVTSGENRGITQRDVWLVLGTSGALWTVLKVAGLIASAAAVKP